MSTFTSLTEETTDYDRVLAKLKRINEQQQDQQYKCSDTILQDKAKALCNAQAFEQQFLNINSESRHETFETLQNFCDEQRAKTIYDSDDDAIKTIPPSKQFNPMQGSVVLDKEVAPIRIHLCVAKLPGNEKSFLAKMGHAVAGWFNMQHDFGLNHVAVIVGPWKLEWSVSEIVEPRGVYSHDMVACINVGKVTSMVDMQLLVNTLSQICVDYNSNYHYDTYSSTEKGANCHDFVLNVMEKLKFPLDKLDPCIVSYLQHIKTQGIAEAVFHYDDAFALQFNLSTGPITFTTHEQLDTFYAHLLQQCPTFSIAHRGKWKLLKAFDRAFWIRHALDPKNTNFCCASPHCTFDNPLITQSVITSIQYNKE